MSTKSKTDTTFQIKDRKPRGYHKVYHHIPVLKCQKLKKNVMDDATKSSDPLDLVRASQRTIDAYPDD